MKRKIYIISIGFVCGIIGELLLKKFSFFMVIVNIFVILLKIFQIQNKKYRFFKIFINNNTIIIILTSAIIASVYINLLEKKYNTVYEKFSEKEIVATVIEGKEEEEYYNKYLIKLENKKYVKLILKVKKDININYGDKIKVFGEYIVPDTARNYKGFNYRDYLKSFGIYGTYKAQNVEIISSNNVNILKELIYITKEKIIHNSQDLFSNSENGVFLEMIIGCKEFLQDDINESFRNSNLSHLLVISGMHITYLVLGLKYFLNLFRISKNISYIIIIFVLIFYMCLVGFTPSVSRVSVMQILILVSILMQRKVDLKTSISFSLLLILMKNPYTIFNISFQLTYLATIGILLLNVNKEKEKNKIKKYILETIKISIYVNIFVAPVLIYNFNTISLSFLISNILTSFLILPIIIGGLCIIIISFINIKIIIPVTKIYNLLLVALINIAKIISKIEILKITVKTPNCMSIVIYYTLLIIIIYYNYLNKNYNNRFIIKRINYIYKNILMKIKNNIFNLVVVISVSIVIFVLIKLVPTSLKLYFIDVGQGDSTLIITSTNKKILIDTGGSEDYNIGDNVLVPYLLDRKINKIDYVIISHFDTDHCLGLKEVLKNIKVDNIIISKQYEETENFKEIYSLIKEKGIHIFLVEANNKITIDTYTQIIFLSPPKELYKDLNDNSLVFKINYKNKSILFTGDISQEIEMELINKYNNYLKSDILKVAHHGSKFSSSEQFIKEVSPNICLIGVGENNKFGHPSSDVIKRLEEIKSNIYRTDKSGEIEILLSNKKIKVKEKIKQ